MIVETAHPVRHLVGRLERGQRLPDALLAVAREHHVRAGWLGALGAFEAVTLVEYDQREKRYKEPRRFEGVMEVLSLVGNLSLKDGEPFAHLHATVSRETDNGIEVLGGHLVDARVFALEVTVAVYEGVTLERALDPTTGLALWRAGAHAPGPSPSPKAAAAVIAAPTREAPPIAPAHPPAAPPRTLVEAARQLEELPPRPERLVEPDFGPEILVKDILLHPTWKEVVVEKESEPGRFLVRLPSGSVRPISTEVFDVVAQGERNGHKVYLLRPKRA